MAKWQPQYPINTNAGGDTVYDGFVKANNEYQAIYDRLNELRVVRASATPPADAEQYELWLDTSVSPPKLRYFDGLNWVDADELIPQGSGSGLDADKVDGADASATPTANTIPIADANGFLNSWINQGAGSGLDADLIRGLPGDFSNSKLASGYQKLPSGLIIQWGRATIPASGTATSFVDVTFPIAFPNDIFVAFCITTANVNSTWGGVAAPSSRSLSLTGFTALFSINGHTTFDQSQEIYWLAIGY